MLYLSNLSDTKSVTEYNLVTILLLIVISIVTFSGQITLVLAYQYENASKVAIFSYLQTFLVMTYDSLFFGTTFMATDFIGAGLILGCNFTIAF